MVTEYFEQYFAQYLFLDTFPNDAYHQFFITAGHLYKPHGNRTDEHPRYKVDTTDESSQESDVWPEDSQNSD